MTQITINGVVYEIPNEVARELNHCIDQRAKTIMQHTRLASAANNLLRISGAGVSKKFKREVEDTVRAAIRGISLAEYQMEKAKEAQKMR